MMSYSDDDPLSTSALSQTSSGLLSHRASPSHASSGAPVITQDNKEILALQTLGQLQNSGRPVPGVSGGTEPEDKDLDQGEEEEQDDDEYYDTKSTISSRQRLYRKMRNHPIVNSAVQVYKSNKPAIKYGVEIVEKATQPVVTIIEDTREEWRRKRRLSKANAMFPDDAKVDISSHSLLPSSKRQKLPSISEALSMGNKNWNELSVNMSIESKKRLQTCLQLLMLANKQLSAKVSHLQELIAKEHELLTQKHESDVIKDEDGEIFHDASDTMSATDQIRCEIVGTVKKIVTFISKYGGNSLPEPARSDVREELLRLPNRWASTQGTQSVFNYSTNAKVLVLANDSLDMVSSVMSVFDDTLTKAEFWVKQKQEKQLAKHAILNNSIKRREESLKLANGSTYDDDIADDVLGE